MNKIIILSIIFIITCFVHLINSSNDNAPVTIIVNPTIDNTNYQPGDLCGDTLANACNNIQDTIKYFNTISQVIDPTSSTNRVYQPLNIQLADGTYTVDKNCVNLFEFNVTISPLINDSENVIFDGSKNINSVPLFTVQIAPGYNDFNQLSHAIITGITFNNFQQPILTIVTTQAESVITFDKCDFNYYQGGGSVLPMFNANKDITTHTNFKNPNTYLTISNSEIRSATLLSSVIKGANCLITIQNAEVSDITSSDSIINTNYGLIEVIKSSFDFNSNVNGVFSTLDSLVSLSYSSFVGNTGSVLSFTSYVVSENQFTINNCQFYNNTAHVSSNGGTIIALNSSPNNEDLKSTIVDSSFTGGYASMGGVIYTSNVPIDIDTSKFGNNSASLYGGSFYVSGTSFGIYDSSFVESQLSEQQLQQVAVPINNGVILYAKDSSHVTIDSSTFYQIDTSSTWYCDESSFTFSNIIQNFTTYIFCNHCLPSSFNSQIICETATTSGRDSSLAINIHIGSSTTLLLLLFTILNSLLLLF